jgi:hypothetical protein
MPSPNLPIFKVQGPRVDKATKRKEEIITLHQPWEVRIYFSDCLLDINCDNVIENTRAVMIRVESQLQNIKSD